MGVERQLGLVALGQGLHVAQVYVGDQELAEGAVDVEGELGQEELGLQHLVVDVEQVEECVGNAALQDWGLVGDVAEGQLAGFAVLVAAEEDLDVEHVALAAVSSQLHSMCLNP